MMFKRMECVAIYTKEVENSLAFYQKMGLQENWKIYRRTNNNNDVTLIGLKFPEGNSSELVLQNDPDLKVMDMEIFVGDVRETYQAMKEVKDVKWIEEPFSTESGHVAVMEAPDGNVFVLIGQ